MPTIWVAQDEADRGDEQAEKHLKNMARTPLDAGDYVFSGRSSGRDVLVAVERKKVNEDLAYCVVATHRHLDQLRRCLEAYDAVYLVVEGEIREDASGLVTGPHWVTPQGAGRPRVEFLPLHKGLTYTRLTKHLETLERKVFVPGKPCVRVRRTMNYRETCRWLQAAAEWWETGVERHGSADEFPEPFTLGATAGLVPRIAKELRGVGLERAGRVGRVAATPAKLHEKIMAGTLVEELDALKDPVSGKTRKTGLRIEEIREQWRGDSDDVVT